MTEKAYRERIGGMARFYQMETHEELDKALIFHLGQVFRSKPYDNEFERGASGKGGAGDEYSAFRRRLFSLAPSIAINELFKAQKSKIPIRQEHFNYFISDLTDLYHDRLYAHGAAKILKVMHREGGFRDESTNAFNRLFLHRPLKYATYLIEVARVVNTK